MGNVMSENEFLKLVDNYTDQDESVLGDLLNIVTQKYNRMVEREKNRRDSAHYKAMRDLLDQIWVERIFNKKNPKLFDNTSCCTMLDAMINTYPTCDAGCQAGEELLEHYAKSVKALGWKSDDQFIKDVRECSEWLEKLYEKY